MPRDGSGNYTLPAGNPVNPGATIESNWANSTMDDLAVSMTDSLSRSGSGSMLVPFQNIDGAETLPGITWAQEPSTGFFRETTGDMRWSILSVAQGRMTTTKQLEVFRDAGFRTVLDDFTNQTILGDWTFQGTVSYEGQILQEDGDATLPPYSFTAAPDTGMYRGVGFLGFSVGGVEQFSVSETSAGFAQLVRAANGDPTLPAWSFLSNNDMGMYLKNATNIGFATGGVERLAVGSTIQSAVAIRNADGSAALPGYSFTNDATTGMYRPGTSIGFAVSGADVLFILPNQMRSDVVGSATLPAWSFSADIGMGMYRGGAGVLAFATEGVQRFNLVSSGANFLVPRVLMENGNATAPAWSFTSQPNMGMYRDTTDRLSFATAGALKGFFDAQGFTSQAKVTAQVGTEAAPSFTFAGFPDVGLFGASNSISATVSGATVWSMSSNGMFAGAGFRIQADGNMVLPNVAFSFGNDSDTGLYRVGPNISGIAGAGRKHTDFNCSVAGSNVFTATQSSATGNYAMEFRTSAGVIRHSLAFDGTAGFNPTDLVLTYYNAAGAFINNALIVDPDDGNFLIRKPAFVDLQVVSGVPGPNATTRIAVYNSAGTLNSYLAGYSFFS